MSTGSSTNMAPKSEEQKRLDRFTTPQPKRESVGGVNLSEAVSDLGENIGEDLERGIKKLTGADVLEEQLEEQKKQTKLYQDEQEKAKADIEAEQQKLRDEANLKQEGVTKQQKEKTKRFNNKRRKKKSLLYNVGGARGLLGTDASLY